MAVLKQKPLTQPKFEILDGTISFICPEIDLAVKKIIDCQTGALRLQEAMAYVTLKGGKRFRPLLIKASGDLFQIPFKTLLPIAVAVEMLHAYSLVHDDLPSMDNADMRRGLPSCWRQFDEATAILAGDALLTLAFEVLATAPLPPDVCLELVIKFAKACGANGMAAGQMLDISQDHDNQPEKIENLQKLKTGELIAFCCEIGAIVAEADSKQKEVLKEAGYKIGLIYQMTDDLLDLKGNVVNIGKPVNQDIDKVTIVSLLGVDKTGKIIESHLNEIKLALENFGSKALLFEEIIDWVIVRES